MPTQMEVEYWRNQYQRMNKERFLAANAMALITHTLVGNAPMLSHSLIIHIDATNGLCQVPRPTAARRKRLLRHWLPQRYVHD